MNGPHIYVIIPVYNSEHLLDHTMNSVLNQPYKNISFVLVDDGSKDNSPELCDKYASEHDNVFVLHQTNQGVSAARNNGIDYVLSLNPNNNDYIAFLDSDDLWAKDFLSSDLIEYFDEDVISFQSCCISFDASMCSYIRTSISKICVEKGGAQAVFRHPFHFGACLYRVSLFENFNIRFDATLKYSEDKVLLTQLFYLAENIRFIPKMMYLYRRNPTSTMYVRPYGISYYEPIINGWLNSDEKMNSLHSIEREKLTAGYVLASIYVVDMSKEHYWYWGKAKELYGFLENHRIFPIFLALSKDDVSPKNFKEHLLFIKHPLLFRTKHMALGLIIRLFKCIARIGFVSNILSKREFTNTNIYI